MKGLFDDIKLVLAPMAGYTDVGFRALCIKYGAQLTVTEMVSAKALTYHNHITKDLLVTHPTEKLKCVQLFGNDPNVFREAVMLPEIKPFDVIDINMGCPVHKIVDNGEGSSLMKDMSRASSIIKAVKTSGKTVMVKFRKGYSENDANAPDFAKMCEDSGADAITIHGRTKSQMYSGKADWNIIGEAVKRVKIPVYLNGDVRSAEDMKSALDISGAHGVAIGRGATGKPWIFSELANKKEKHDLYEDIVFHYSQLSYLPENVVVNEMKKHMACYLKGLQGGKKLLVSLVKMSSIESTLQAINDFFGK